MFQWVQCPVSSLSRSSNLLEKKWINKNDFNVCFQNKANVPITILNCGVCLTPCKVNIPGALWKNTLIFEVMEKIACLDSINKLNKNILNSSTHQFPVVFPNSTLNATFNDYCSLQIIMAKWKELSKQLREQIIALQKQVKGSRKGATHWMFLEIPIDA